MEKDCLKIFDRELAADLQRMNDDELWDFIQSREETVKGFFENGKGARTGVFYAYRGGQEHYRKHFLNQIEECRAGVIYTMILDFCLGDEEIKLGYWAISGFLDDPGSCAVKTSEEIMPTLPDPEEEIQRLFSKVYFHLLENKHALNIIRSMKANSDKLSLNTAEDIGEIERMRKFCEKNPNYQFIYLYDIVQW